MLRGEIFMVLRFIILGLLKVEPMTGYDLKTFFNKSVNFFWSADLSQIYKELSKLMKQGLISCIIEKQEGRPDKKVYSITPEGEQEFGIWLRDFPQNLTPTTRNEFLVRIFFSNDLPKDELSFQFRKFIKEKEEELKVYKDIENNMETKIKEGAPSSQLFNQKLTLRRGITFAHSEISWATECLEEIEKLDR